MTTHVCRDFLSTGNPLSTMVVSALVMYYSAMFMRITLGYTLVGQTNFNIDSATYKLGSGAGGSLNQGTGDEYAFSPNGYTVSSLDINRILVLKSPGYPMVNSGLFRVTAIDTSNNWLYINYRSGDSPPAESGMTWALYEHESTFISALNVTGNNNSTEYTGRTTATQNRIILQSPSSINWQVRIAIENSFDQNSSSGPVSGYNTFAPGFGGDSAGDFQPGGQHLHAGLFFNKRTRTVAGGAVGWSGNTSNTQARIYMWGDDSTGSFVGINRYVTTTSASDSWIALGLPEDEEQPLPPKSAQRLFAIGSIAANNSIGWYGGTVNDGGRAGVAFGLSNQPISCIYSIYTPLSNTTFGGRVARNTTTAGDSPYLSATELLSVDLLAGTQDNMYLASDNEVFTLEGRRLGRAPFVRMGRSNYGYFQIAPSADGNTWLHTVDGVYLPWQGAILP